MKMYCQQYLFLISFILIVPDTLQGSHSKPSPFCAVGRAVNKHPVLIKKYCGPHVIGCLRSETSKINIRIIMTLKILFLS